MTMVRVSVREALTVYLIETMRSGVDINLLKFWKDNDTVEYRTEQVDVQVEDEV
jgi:hypothetical protein